MKLLKNIAILSTVMLYCCTSPADVDALKVITPEEPGPVNTSALKFESKYLDFGYVVQSGSISVQLPLYNLSMVDTVTVKTLTLVSGKKHFRVVINGGLPLVLAPGMNTAGSKILIEFFPKEKGEFEDTLYVNGDRKNFVALHGLAGEDSRPPSVAIENISFGDVSVGTSQERTTDVLNLDQVPLTIAIEKLPANEESPFSIITPPGEYTIAPGVKKSFTVMFAPKEEREYSRSMKLYIRGATGQLKSIFTVSGKGTK